MVARWRRCLAAGCAAGQAFRQGEERHEDAAISTWPSPPIARPSRRRPTTPATRSRCSGRCSPRRARISIGRASSRRRISSRRRVGEYRQASEYDPSNRLIGAKVAELDKTIRERDRSGAAGAGDPATARAGAGRVAPPPLLNPLARAAADELQQHQPARHPELHRGRDRDQRHLRPRQSPDRAFTVQLDGVTLEQALNQILSVTSCPTRC